MIKMTIGAKLGWTGGMLVCCTAILGGVSLLGLRSIGVSEHRLVDDAVNGIVASSKAEATMLEMRGDILRRLAALDSAERLQMDGRIERLRRRLAAELEATGKSVTSDEERLIFGKIHPALDAYLNSWDEITKLSSASDNAEALATYINRAALFVAVQNAIREDAEYNRRICNEYAEAAAATRGRIASATWVTLTLSVICGGGVIFLIVRGLNRQLSSAVADLSLGADQVMAASGHVSASSQSLAEGAAEQAASLEQTSASSEEISSMVKASADQAQSAAGLVAEIQQRFRATGDALSEMQTAMDEISQSSSQISKIIEVIDSIAFQTNILALNAAVEAARAGEAGMGFAVVAHEVRSLAQRSAQAARDTTSLIEGSINRSRNGKEKLKRVSEEVLAVTGQSEKVKSLVDQIYRASGEQTDGVAQVALAIVQIERVTQSAAANAEECASAAEELTAQSRMVRGVVQTLDSLVRGSRSDADAIAVLHG